VIGINTAILSPSGGSIGIGFATPAATVVPVIDQLEKIRRERRGWVGVHIQNVDDTIAESLDLGAVRGVEKAPGMELSSLTDDLRQKFAIKYNVAAGVVITGVDPDSAAAEKHVQAGDVVMELNQEPVKQPANMAKKIQALKCGSKKSALLLVANGQGEVRFVALGLP
jgi:S1-C subfamily serine protease